jgi:hypothetical protein
VSEWRSAQIALATPSRSLTSGLESNETREADSGALMSTEMSRAQKVIIGLLAFWMALIFGTSCTVIHFDQFVRFVQGLGGGSGFNAWFANFWLVSWFVVVKGWHATEYAILLCFCVLVLRRAGRWSYQRSVGAAFVFAVLFAASDEWHQTFVPGRDGCVRDVLIDSAGAAVAAICLLARRARQHA